MRKGKQKERLYLIREKEKLERRRKRKRVKSYLPRKDTNINNANNNNFVGKDYFRVLKQFENNNFKLLKYQYKLQKCESIIIPETFSFYENPEVVIYILRKIYMCGKNRLTRKIIFDHTDCKNLELAASTTLDVVVLAIDQLREVKRSPIQWKGSIPNDSFAKDVLLASGLPYHLKAFSLASVHEEQMEKFPIIKGIYDPAAKKAGIIATQMTEYFNQCLKTQNLMLNAAGLSLLGLLLGEVITNCEIHGGKGSTWYTQGHYQIREQNACGEMQLVFLNLGNTIYEGLRNNSSEETRVRIDHILNCHKKYINEYWTEELILTVFALQEGISRLRDNNIEGYSERGTGTVSMIDQFYSIGGSDQGLKPRMSIISGNVQIVFDDKYRLKDVAFNHDNIFGSGTRKIIAFNTENDIYKPANRNNVRKMNDYFPGTVISLDFYLDSKYIENKKRSENR